MKRHFSRFVQPLKCLACGRMSLPAPGAIGPQLCEDCYDLAGLENEHSDGHHADEPNPACPECQPKTA